MLAGLVKVQFNILVRVRACNKNIRPGKERSKEASRHLAANLFDQSRPALSVGDPAFKRLSTRNISCDLSQNCSNTAFLRQDLRGATGLFLPPARLSPV